MRLTTPLRMAAVAAIALPLLAAPGVQAAPSVSFADLTQSYGAWPAATHPAAQRDASRVAARQDAAPAEQRPALAVQLDRARLDAFVKEMQAETLSPEQTLLRAMGVVLGLVALLAGLATAVERWLNRY